MKNLAIMFTPYSSNLASVLMIKFVNAVAKRWDSEVKCIKFIRIFSWGDSRVEKNLHSIFHGIKSAIEHNV